MNRLPFLLSGDAFKIRESLEKDYKKNDVFGKLRQEVSTVGASAFNLVVTGALAVIAITFLISAIKLAGNPKKREEGKERLMYTLFAAGAVFSVLTVIDLIGYIVVSGTQ